MYPFVSSLRAAFGPAPGNASAAPSRPARQPWLVTLLLVVGLAGFGASAAVDAASHAGLRVSVAGTALLDGLPPAPVDLPLHQPGIAEPDAETGHGEHPKATAQASAPIRATRNDAVTSSGIALAPAAAGQPHRTPPAHAPPAASRRQARARR